MYRGRPKTPCSGSPPILNGMKVRKTV